MATAARDSQLPLQLAVPWFGCWDGAFVDVEAASKSSRRRKITSQRSLLSHHSPLFHTTPRNSAGNTGDVTWGGTTTDHPMTTSGIWAGEIRPQ